jgi:hypothetical protein
MERPEARERRPMRCLRLAAVALCVAIPAAVWTGPARGATGDHAPSAAELSVRAAALLRQLQTLAVDELSRHLKSVTPWWNARASKHGAVLLIEARELPVPGRKRGAASGAPADPWQTTVFVWKKPVAPAVLEQIRRLVEKHGGVLEDVPLWTPDEFSQLSGAPSASPELKKVRGDLRGHSALIYRLLPDPGTK